MELCIPDSRREAELEGEEIGRILNEFLAGLSKESRILFLRRYWYAESIAEIAGRYGMGESKVKTSLHRSRNKLRQHLEKEGIRL
jgi:RNA polymerase sigma-70 factor (ECF subfamily)